MEDHPIYLIRLHPLDTYFFGGEVTFGEDSANYFAKSNPMPQQTTLLGVLRQWVLFQNRNRGFTDEQLIGKESFNPDGSILDYGFIKRISSLLLFSTDEAGNTEFWAPFCRDSPFRLISKAGKSRFSPKNAKEFVPLLEGYEVKKGLEEGFISLSDGTKMGIESDPQKAGHDWRTAGPFHPTFQVGIAKQRLQNDEDDSGGYFKKKAYRLNPHFDFAFFAELYPAAELKSTVMNVGADGCPFALKVEKWQGTNPLAHPADFFKKMESQTKGNRIVCLSDAILRDIDLENCALANNPISTFRNIRSKIGHTENYSRLGKSDNQKTPFKTGRINLVSKGSSFHHEEGSEPLLTAALDQPGYQIIGLNQYYPITSQISTEHGNQ